MRKSEDNKLTNMNVEATTTEAALSGHHHEVFVSARELTNANRPAEYTTVKCFDEPGQGNMCHSYQVFPLNRPSGPLSNIQFQKGPVKESGVNGCHHEDLILIVVDRLKGAQAGDYACRENEMALQHLEEALLWLNYRTNARKQRGVEGTSIK